MPSMYSERRVVAAMVASSCFWDNFLLKTEINHKIPKATGITAKNEIAKI